LADHQAADRLEEARGAVAGAESALTSARAGLDLAEKTRQRFARLMANQAVTPQEMDRIDAELEQARQQVQGAEADLAGARAGAAAARTAASWSRVTAPYAARIVRHQVEVGSTVMPGTPLLLLDRLGEWQIRATVPESRIGLVTLGERVSVALPARDLELPATVRQILPATDPLSRSFEIKLTLEEAPELAAGLFARVYLPAPDISTLLVPAAAVVERGQLHGLYVVTEGRLHFRLVRLGRNLDQQVEVLSGLEPGETIVVEGVERAQDGARVEG
jgi:RND family efflux transporter MFP subunit